MGAAAAVAWRNVNFTALWRWKQNGNLDRIISGLLKSPWSGELGMSKDLTGLPCP
jgi:hypothetical protein